MKQDIRLTNRTIARAFGCTIHQMRRWARVACGIDSKADKSSGVVRKYSLDDGFKIFMIGQLVTQLKMDLVEAKMHLANLWPYLEQYSLLPSKMESEILKEVDVRIYVHS